MVNSLYTVNPSGRIAKRGVPESDIEPQTGQRLSSMKRLCQRHELDLRQHIERLVRGDKFCGNCQQYLPATTENFPPLKKGLHYYCRACNKTIGEGEPSDYNREETELQIDALHAWTKNPDRLCNRLKKSPF